MSIFGKLWKCTTSYRLYNFIRSGFQYRRDLKYVGETFYSSAFHKVIKKYLGVNLKEDWIGRLYGVANPNIKDGKWDVSTMIIEIDGDNTNTNEGVRQWAFKQMQLIAQLFKIENMYDYISMEFKHVGPEELDNYLIIFDITSRIDFAKATRKFTYNMFGILAIIGILLLIV
jgi:hypothetical protein